MLCQTLVKELDRLFVLLLLIVGVTDPGISPAKGQEKIDFVLNVKLIFKTFTLVMEINFDIKP